MSKLVIRNKYLSAYRDAFSIDSDEGLAAFFYVEFTIALISLEFGLEHENATSVVWACILALVLGRVVYVLTRKDWSESLFKIFYTLVMGAVWIVLSAWLTFTTPAPTGYKVLLICLATVIFYITYGSCVSKMMKANKEDISSKLKRGELTKDIYRLSKGDFNLEVAEIKVALWSIENNIPTRNDNDLLSDIHKSISKLTEAIDSIVKLSNSLDRQERVSVMKSLSAVLKARYVRILSVEEIFSKKEEGKQEYVTDAHYIKLKEMIDELGEEILYLLDISNKSISLKEREEEETKRLEVEQAFKDM